MSEDNFGGFDVVTDSPAVMLSGGRTAELEAITRQKDTMSTQSPAFFSDAVPAAFSLDNEVVSALVSKSISHIGDDYDKDFRPQDNLGEHKNLLDNLGALDETQSNDLDRMLSAKNASHLNAIKEDIKREREQRDILGSAGASGVIASLAAGILSPFTLLPAGSIIKGARGISVLKTSAKSAGIGAGAMTGSEALLQATQQTRTGEESGYAIAGGAILGGILGAGAAKISKNEFNRLAKKLETDLTRVPEPDATDIKSVGAAEVEQIPAAELIIAGKAAQKYSNALRPINPFLRLANSTFAQSRRMLFEMAEMPLEIEANRQGKSLGLSVETEIKLYDKGIAESYKAIKDQFALYKKAEPQGMNMPYITFREKVSEALRNNDMALDGNNYVTNVARKIRAEVFDPLKQEAIKLKLLPEGVTAKFADSYLTRIWHREKLIADREGALKMFSVWADEKVRLFIDDTNIKITNLEKRLKSATKESRLKIEEQIAELRLSIRKTTNIANEGYDEYVRDVAEEIYNKLIGVGDNEVPDFIAPITRGVLKEKLLDIPDNVAAKYLENDIGKIINTYTRQMGSQIAFTRKFGDATLKNAFQKLDDEFNQAMRDAQGNEKISNQLAKQYKQDKKDLSEMRDLLRGTYVRSKDPDGILSQAATVIKDLNFMSKMGGVLFSSIPDISRNIMVNGFQDAFGDLTARLSLPKNLKKMQREELQEMGFDFEAVMASRLATLADVSDPHARGTALTRLTGTMSAGFSKLTMINAWNDIMKNWAATTTQRRILKNIDNAVAGKLSAKDKAYFNYLGINKDIAGVIAEQFKKHGTTKDGAFISGIKNWDDTNIVNHAARIYKGALRKEADTIIVTKGISDVPSFANTPVGSLILQFRSFIFAANQRVLLRGMQDADANVLMGVIISIAAGMVIAAIKKAEYDVSKKLTGEKNKKEDLANWTASKWVQEGVDRSGLLGIIWEANNIYEKAGGFGLTQAMGNAPVSRYQSRNIAGAIFGPTIGTAADAGSFVGVANSTLTGREVTNADIKSIRNIIPFQNLIGVKHLFDAVQGQIPTKK